MKRMDCFSIALFKNWNNFCWLPVHFAMGRICVCSKYTAILFPSVNYANETCGAVPLSLYFKVKANVCILKISKILLGFQVKIQNFQELINFCMGVIETSLLTCLITV